MQPFDEGSIANWYFFILNGDNFQVEFKILQLGVDIIKKHYFLFTDYWMHLWRNHLSECFDVLSKRVNIR